MSNGRLKDLNLRRVRVSSNVCLHCVEFGVYIMSGSNLYQENSFKPCLTKQLLNVFKLWCERGIRVLDNPTQKLCGVSPALSSDS